MEKQIRLEGIKVTSIISEDAMWAVAVSEGVDKFLTRRQRWLAKHVKKSVRRK